jgi:hypothetical protein
MEKRARNEEVKSGEAEADKQKLRSRSEEVEAAQSARA